MKVQHRIDVIPENEWPRPSKVTIHGDSLECEFEPARYYDLQGSYRFSPHSQFLNARTDSEMSAFVKAWGPLYLRLDQPCAGVVTHALSEYHAKRRRLAAILGLINGIGEAAVERERLQEFLNADPPGHFAVRSAVRVLGSITEWAAQAKPTEVRSAIKAALHASVLAPSSFLKVVARGKKPFVTTQWAFPALETALSWMVWYDVYRNDPLYCCGECRRFFKSESRHERKFCDDPKTKCARRASGRNWRRKDLANKRLAKEANTKKGEVNVTHKTR